MKKLSLKTDLIINIAIAACIVIAAAICDYKVLDDINERVEVYTRTEPEEQIEQQIQDTYIAALPALADNIIQLQYVVRYYGDEMDFPIQYMIVDDQNNIVLENAGMISDMLENYGDYYLLDLDCSNGKFESGKTYTLFLKTNNYDTFIVTDNQGTPQQFQHTNFENKGFMIALVVCGNLLLLVMLWLIIKFGMTNRIFMIVAFLLGAYMLVARTPLNQDDEYRHFLRIYDAIHSDTDNYYTKSIDTARGNFSKEDGYYNAIDVPYELNGLRLLDKEMDIDGKGYDREVNNSTNLAALKYLLAYPRNNDNSYSVSIYGTSRLSALLYLPQIVTAWIAKAIGLNAVWQYYFACAGTLWFSVLMTWICLRLIPEYRNIIILTYFMPMVSWLRVSCNRDILLIELILLFVSYVLYLKREHINVIQWKPMLIMAVSLGIVAVNKLPYIVVALILLMLDRENWKKCSDKTAIRMLIRNMLFVCAMVVLAMLVYKGINVVSSMFVKATVPETAGVASSAEAGIMANKHVKYFIENPMAVIGAIFRRFSKIIVSDIPGAITGYFYCFANTYVYLGAVVALLSSRKMQLKDRIIMLVTFALTWLGVCAAGYIMTKPDYGEIWGIGVRYMIPLIPILALALGVGNDKTDELVQKHAPKIEMALICCNAIRMIEYYM